MSKHTLSNSTDPLHLFTASFNLHFVKSQQESNSRIRAEHTAKERLVIEQLEHERFAAQCARDVKAGWLHKI